MQASSVLWFTLIRPVLLIFEVTLDIEKVNNQDKKSTRTNCDVRFLYEKILRSQIVIAKYVLDVIFLKFSCKCLLFLVFQIITVSASLHHAYGTGFHANQDSMLCCNFQKLSKFFGLEFWFGKIVYSSHQNFKLLRDQNLDIFCKIFIITQIFA